MVGIQRERFDLAAWRLRSAEAFGKMDITTSDPANFYAEVSSVQAAEISLFDMYTAPHTVHRGVHHTTSTDSAWCKLSLQLAGRSTLSQGGRTCDLHPGELVLYMTDQPYVLDYPAKQHSLVVLFPEDLVSLSPSQLRKSACVPLSRESGVGRIVVPIFESFSADLTLLEGPDAITLGHSVIKLLVTALKAHVGPDETLGPGLFDKAVFCIDQNISDHDLSPQKIADALFVSVRHLHSVFSSHGITVGKWIRSRRLDLIRSALADPSYCQEPVAHLRSRYGFYDSAHFSRSFKKEFGLTPTQYRAMACADVAHSSSTD